MFSGFEMVSQSRESYSATQTAAKGLSVFVHESEKRSNSSCEMNSMMKNKWCINNREHLYKCELYKYIRLGKGSVNVKKLL